MTSAVMELKPSDKHQIKTENVIDSSHMMTNMAFQQM